MITKRTLLVAAVAVIGLAGMAAGCNVQTDDNANTPTTTQSNTNTDTKNMSKEHGSTDLQSSLTALLGQHLDLAAAATRAGYDGRTNDFNASAKSLDNNSVAISKAIGSVYGAEAEASFLPIWRSHIGFFIDYTVAAKAGNKVGMDKAVQNLMSYVDESSEFFSKANPNITKADMKAGLTEHVLQLKAVVDAYAAGDFAKSYTEQEMAYMHMGELAQTLSDAISKQFPDKF